METRALRPRFAGASPADLQTNPLIVFYEVTQACDLACQHCRACAQPLAAPTELTPNQSRQLVDQLLEFPTPPMLVLTGGDPLKRPDIFALIRYATRGGLDVSITPSATPLVTRHALEELVNAGVSRMAISIDGADAATHDAFRRVPGSFQRSLEILRDARELGLATQINTTLAPHNRAQIERMAQLGEELGVVLWSVFFLVPVGRGQVLERLRADAIEDVFGELWVESQRRPFGIKTTEAPHYRRYVLQQRVAQRGTPANGHAYVGANLNDGKGILFVRHSGEIYPSGFLPLPCGQFPANHLVEVYQNSPVFRALREPEKLEGKCHACEYRHVCGGSRARAYAVSGRVMAAEPDCLYEPRAVG